MRTPFLAVALACLAAASPPSPASAPAGRPRGRQAPANTPACMVDPAGPSLAPAYVYDGAPGQTSFAASPDRVARIGDAHSTVFGFSVPAGGFPPAAGNATTAAGNATTAAGNATTAAGNATCALQFRMPYCRELPAGYPCYVFSGMEQEVLRGGGVRFRRVAGAGYEEAGTVRVFPGANVTVGAAFACPAAAPAAAGAGAGSLWWLADSVRGLRLEFLQGGGASGYAGGVGAWVVACS